MSLPRQIKVLLIEDDLINAQLVKRMLTRPSGFTATVSLVVDCVHTLAEARAFLAALRPTAILLDLTLPDSQGVKTLTAVQAAALDVPIIVVSGMADETMVNQLFANGAQDFLLKGDVKSGALAQAVINAVLRHQYVPRPRAAAKACLTTTTPLVERDPSAFTYLARRVAHLLTADAASQADYAWPQEIASLTAELIRLAAHPDDVAALHTAALQRLFAADAGVQNDEAYFTTGRVLMLELMGGLAASYHSRLTQSMATPL